MAASFALCTAATAENLRNLCPDRPGKGTAPCTVDAGHFQVEADIFNGSFQRREGVTTETYVVTNPTIKFGLTESWDIEANFAPYTVIRTHGANTGRTQNIGGVGDIFLRTKLNILGNNGGAFAIAVDPYIKLPTAHVGIGNGAVEGGLLIPMTLSLEGGWSLGTTPEFDTLKNSADNGRHLNVTNVLGLNRAFANGIVLGAELWSSADLDPIGTTRRYTFDLYAAWQPLDDANLQYDGGVNRGLNGNTPGWQVYVGVTRRF